MGIILGCQTTEKPDVIRIELQGTPESIISERLDNDGEATFDKEIELSIGRRNAKHLNVRSFATFVSVSQGVVTRVVYTPMQDAADLSKALQSLDRLFEWFGQERREQVALWLNDVRMKQGVVADEHSRHSAKFDLSDDIEIYVEIRPVPGSQKWYTSVHLYAKKQRQTKAAPNKSGG